MKEILWNSQQGRLRACWRLLGQSALFLGGLLATQIAFGLLVAAVALLRPGGALPGAILDHPAIGLAGILAVLGWAVASVALAGRFLDRRRLADFGLHFGATWWLDLGFGLVLGALLMAGIFLVKWAAGWLTVTGTLQVPASGQSFGQAILLALGFYVAVGIYEELLLRGYQLRNLAEGLNGRALGARGGVLVAWLISSAIFGLLHALNPNATATSTANLTIAGLFLGLGYVLTGELAIPIGLHITWNLFQGNVFGFAVSGMPSGPTFLATLQHGPELWTGGAFGPEGGLLGLGAMLAGSLLTLPWVRLRYGQVAIRGSLARAPQAASPAWPQADHSVSPRDAETQSD